MSSIRPLATIAVLAALGVYLAQQINQGPSVAMDDQWAHPAGPETGEPPAWDGGGEAPAAIEAPTLDEPAFGAVAPPAEMPAMPTLPDEPAKTAAADALPLPANIPTASYGDATQVETPTITGRVPSLGSSTPGTGAGLMAAAPAAPAAPAPPSGFEVAWEAIQAALEHDELPRAHRMLSQWRNDPGLSPNEQQRVDALLSQLAGSVVYSAEHRLEPPHIVAPGETLESIAAQYQAPWRLLAKINGVASSTAVTPGQTLKVLRGPFDAEVDLRRGELVLLLDDRYAGKFPVRVEGAAPSEGEWRVGQKRVDQSNSPLVGAVVPTSAASSMDPKVVLENSAGQKLELSAGATPPAGAAGRLTVASSDLADLYDILSVGSSVTIRR